MNLGCSKMATDSGVDEVVAKFYHDTSLQYQLKWYNLWLASCCTELATCHKSGDAMEFIPLSTGSNAEFYIDPMLSCVGDFDIMFHRSDQLAIPAGHPPPTQLPTEFCSSVGVYRVINSEFPGCVYLILSYLLIENAIDGKYSAYPITHQFISHSDIERISFDSSFKPHGPAYASEWDGIHPLTIFARIDGENYCCDRVPCVRCLRWPPQAADWPKRRRKHGWPDSATVDRVVSNGCDVVPVAHSKCRQDKWKGKYQFRLSFSRAEIVLLNSWMPVQQIVYHMLRVFVKIEKLTHSSSTLSNYHVKTLMLSACELKPERWWTNDMNVVEICLELLHVLGVWLRDGRCKHYFISNCNLLDQCDNETATKLLSVKKEWLANWFVDNCIRKCAEGCHDSVSRLFNDVSSSKKLRCAVSAVIDYRKISSPVRATLMFMRNHDNIAVTISTESLTMRSSLCWLQELEKFDQKLCVYFTAVAFLHVARKAAQNLLTHQLLGSLVVICRHLVNTRSATDDVQKHFRNGLQQFVTKVPILNLLFHANTTRNSRLLIVIEEQMKQGYQLDKAELVELLQRYAVKYMSIYRQIAMRNSNSDSGFHVVPVDLEASYAYKRGELDRCFHLSSSLLFYSIQVGIDRQKSKTASLPIIAYPEFILLMDNDIVSLIGLMLLAEPSCRDISRNSMNITQHILSVYLLSQCGVNPGFASAGRPPIDAMLYGFEILYKGPSLRYSTLGLLMLKLLERKLRRLRDLGDSAL